MDEQRARAKADAAARKTGHGRRRRSTAPCSTRPGPPTSSATAELTSESRRRRAARRRRRGARGRRGRPASRWCWTARPSTPRAAASRPTRGSSAATAFTIVVDDVQSPVAGLRRAPRQGDRGRGHGRRDRVRRGRHRRAGPRCRARTPRPTSCTPACAAHLGDDGRTGRVAERPGPAAVRLHLARRGGAGRRCWTRSRTRSTPSCRTTRRSGRSSPRRRGPPPRRDGAVRREVRRRGARRRDRRLLPRAVRRHARAPLRPARVGEAAVGELHRLRGAPRGGAGRHRRLPLTWPASTCWSASSPSSSRPVPRSCPSASAGSSSGCGRPSGSWRRSGQTPCSPRPGRWPTGAEDIGGVAVVAAAVPEGVSGNDLRALATDVRSRLGARPGVVALFSTTEGKVVVRRRDHGRRAGSRAGRRKAGADVRPRRRRSRRREAGPGAGRRLGPLGDPGGAGPPAPGAREHMTPPVRTSLSGKPLSRRETSRRGFPDT